MSELKGSFTLPGEAGYEQLTLRMAEKWGADVIRDSDGTVLSPEITNAGYGIYSTICIIRDHNTWALNNKDKLQQSFLMAGPVIAHSDKITVPLLNNYYNEQFEINTSEDSIKYWQVFDRTTGEEIPRKDWKLSESKEEIIISNVQSFHEYTVNFLAYQKWEQISMYNHVTNHWDKEHLMPIDPRYPETQKYLLCWLDNWCKTHPTTTVVRFTSLFYNFAWIWGSDERNRFLFSDWASYDFTVSPKALDEFAKQYGYSLTSEDFINKGDFHVTHMPCDEKKKDWMEFTVQFVAELGKQMVDIVHEYGKQAYVFYDDSWIGLEPYGDKFSEIGFDGIIKCLFSGFEARLCADVPVDTHEIRLHPYLFPVGLGGSPTFMKGGNPTKDAKEYWMRVRRALLRKSVDRIGLGGYLHLTEGFPDFQDYIEKISDEFRRIKILHAQGEPYVLPIRVAVLHFWGKLRSWSLSGHFHETHMHSLIHINEALSGLPLEVEFIDFQDVKEKRLNNYDVIINAGKEGDAWSGGDVWNDNQVVSELYRWVYEGGVFIGVNEPSAVKGYNHFYRMAPVLGVDQDTGAKVCHGKWSFTEETSELIPANSFVPKKENRFLVDGKGKVFMSHDDIPDLVVHDFGKGKGIYLSDFCYSPSNSRLLLNLIMAACGINPEEEKYITDNSETECAFVPNSNTLVVINNSEKEQKVSISTDKGIIRVDIPAFENIILSL